MRSRRHLLSAVSVCALATGAPAQAASVDYADRSSWEAAVGSFDTEDFETTPIQELGCPATTQSGWCVETRLDAPKLDIVVGEEGHGRGRVYEPGVIDGSREFEGDLHGPLTLVSPGPLFNRIEFDQPVTAVAFDLAGVADTYSAYPMIVHVLGDSFPLATGTQFFGLVSDSPFSDVTLTADPEEGGNYFYSLDNVSFVPVPEPGSFATLCGALAALGWRRRHRNRRPAAAH